jgi:predicted RNA binding protein YcfA (HicA-like mRNA interferase family)
MVKPSKLYEKLVRSPKQIIAFQDFERLLVAFGFTLLRTRGSHRAYQHAQGPGLMVIQPRGSDAKPYQVRQFLDIIEEFNLSMEG